MNKRLIKTTWIKSIITAVWLIFCLSTSVYATWEVSLSNLKETVMLSSDENSLINAAIDRVEKLKTDIESLTDELFKLDAIEKEKNPELSTSYRQARSEIVRVITSIKWANSNLSSSLKKSIIPTKIQNKSIIFKISLK